MLVSESHCSQAEWVREALARYEGPLLRYAARLTGDLEQARDVVQDTFVKLCTADRGKLDGRLGPWLFTVCRNRAFDLSRKERRMSAMTDTQAAAIPSRDPAPSEVAERREKQGRVQRVLDTLPERHRELVHLKFQEGMTYKEISEVTGLSVSNVGFILHTAIKNIRKRLHTDQEPKMSAAEQRPEHA